MDLIAMLCTATGIVMSLMGVVIHAAAGSYCPSDFAWLPASDWMLAQPDQCVLIGIALTAAGLAVQSPRFR